MNLFSQAPFIRLLLPFLLGILSAIYCQLPFDYLSAILIFLFICLITLYASKISSLKYSLRWLNGLIITAFLFLAGYHLTILNTDKYNPHHFSNCPNGGEYMIRVVDMPVEKEKSIKIVADIASVKHLESCAGTMGSAVIYFQKDSISKLISYGDCIFLKTKFTEVNAPQNPGEFNYKKYLSFHNIYHQAYAKSGTWFCTNKWDGNYLIAYALSLREKLLAIFRENRIAGDEYAVGAALILGYEDKLDTNIISAYSATGALHVLSVSGLHVAIIYLVFNWLLGFLDRFKKGVLIKSVLLILLIWFYALLTGLSPSVLRATTMFSFIIIGKSLNRYTNIYNTLAASCFLLLLINPFMIMEVGFQLSYLAVLGIVFIQPKIQKLWEPQNWLMNQVWGITCVSIAAQLATFPLGLLYFHQFPDYFLLSNLVVIPVSTLVLYLGILLFVVSSISPLANFVATGLKYAILFLNESVKWMEHLPYAVIDGISISTTEAWIIYLLLLSVLAFFIYNKINYLKSALAAGLLLLVFQCAELFFQQRQKSIVVYNVPNTSAYDFINGRQTVFISDSSLVNDKSKMLFHIRHHWWNLGLNNHTDLLNQGGKDWKDKEVFVSDNHIQFCSKTIAIVSAVDKGKLRKKLKVNYLILTKNARCNIADVLKHYDFNTLIIDSSNSRRKAEKWLAEAKKLKINCYSVIHSGAFQQEI